MARTPRHAAMWIVRVCFLLVFALAGGYLLPVYGNGGARGVGAANSTGAATSPVAAATGPSGGLADPAAAGGVGRGRGRGGAAAPPDPRTGEICAFDATIYEVRIDPGQISGIDVEALTKAAGGREGFEKALGALGPARALYRAGQGISVGEEQIISILNNKGDGGGAAGVGGRGGGVRTWKEPGVLFDLFVKAGNGELLDLVISIQAAIPLDVAASGPGAAGAAPMRRAEIYQQRPVAGGVPVVFIDGDAVTLDAKGKAVVLITRVVVGVPQPVGSKPVS